MTNVFASVFSASNKGTDFPVEVNEAHEMALQMVHEPELSPLKKLELERNVLEEYEGVLEDIVEFSSYTIMLKLAPGIDNRGETFEAFFGKLFSGVVMPTPISMLMQWRDNRWVDPEWVVQLTEDFCPDGCYAVIAGTSFGPNGQTFRLQ